MAVSLGGAEFIGEAIIAIAVPIKCDQEGVLLRLATVNGNQVCKRMVGGDRYDDSLMSLPCLQEVVGPTVRGESLASLTYVKCFETCILNG